LGEPVGLEPTIEDIVDALIAGRCYPVVPAALAVLKAHEGF